MAECWVVRMAGRTVQMTVGLKVGYLASLWVEEKVVHSVDRKVEMSAK